MKKQPVFFALGAGVLALLILYGAYSYSVRGLPPPPPGPPGPGNIQQGQNVSNEESPLVPMRALVADANRIVRSPIGHFSIRIPAGYTLAGGHDGPMYNDDAYPPSAELEIKKGETTIVFSKNRPHDGSGDAAWEDSSKQIMTESGKWYAWHIGTLTSTDGSAEKLYSMSIAQPNQIGEDFYTVNFSGKQEDTADADAMLRSLSIDDVSDVSAFFSRRSDLLDPAHDELAIIPRGPGGVDLSGWTVRDAKLNKSFPLGTTVLGSIDSAAFIHTVGTRANYSAEGETHLFFGEQSIAWGEHGQIDLVDKAGKIEDSVYY